MIIELFIFSHIFIFILKPFILSYPKNKKRT